MACCICGKNVAGLPVMQDKSTGLECCETCGRKIGGPTGFIKYVDSQKAGQSTDKQSVCFAPESIDKTPEQVINELIVSTGSSGIKTEAKNQMLRMLVKLGDMHKSGNRIQKGILENIIENINKANSAVEQVNMKINEYFLFAKVAKTGDKDQRSINDITQKIEQADAGINKGTEKCETLRIEWISEILKMNDPDKSSKVLSAAMEVVQPKYDAEIMELAELAKKAKQEHKKTTSLMKKVFGQSDAHIIYNYFIDKLKHSMEQAKQGNIKEVLSLAGTNAIETALAAIKQFETYKKAGKDMSQSKLINRFLFEFSKHYHPNDRENPSDISGTLVNK